MNIFSSYKNEFILMALGFLFLATVPMLLERLHGVFVLQNAFLEQQTTLLKRDINKTRLSGSFDPADPVSVSEQEMTDLLAPTDWEFLRNRIQKSTLGYNIANLLIQISDEQPAAEASGLPDIKTSTIKLSGEAPSDVFVQNFLNKAALLLPGRLQMKSLVMKRANEQPLGVSNLHFEATFQWLANKAKAARE